MIPSKISDHVIHYPGETHLLRHYVRKHDDEWKVMAWKALSYNPETREILIYHTNTRWIIGSEYIRRVQDNPLMEHFRVKKTKGVIFREEKLDDPFTYEETQQEFHQSPAIERPERISVNELLRDFANANNLSQVTIARAYKKHHGIAIYDSSYDDALTNIFDIPAAIMETSDSKQFSLKQVASPEYYKEHCDSITGFYAHSDYSRMKPNKKDIDTTVIYYPMPEHIHPIWQQMAFIAQMHKQLKELGRDIAFYIRRNLINQMRLTGLQFLTLNYNAHHILLARQHGDALPEFQITLKKESYAYAKTYFKPGSEVIKFTDKYSLHRENTNSISLLVDLKTNGRPLLCHARNRFWYQ